MWANKVLRGTCIKAGPPTRHAETTLGVLQSAYQSSPLSTGCIPTYRPCLGIRSAGRLRRLRTLDPQVPLHQLPSAPRSASRRSKPRTRRSSKPQTRFLVRSIARYVCSSTSGITHCFWTAILSKRRMNRLASVMSTFVGLPRTRAIQTDL
jgi:hypothetical protein